MGGSGTIVFMELPRRLKVKRALFPWAAIQQALAADSPWAGPFVMLRGEPLKRRRDSDAEDILEGLSNSMIYFGAIVELLVI